MRSYNSKLQIVFSDKLQKFPELVHGFTTRLTDKLDLPVQHIHFSRQIHGNTVQILETSTFQAIPEADGLVTTQFNIALGIKTADCVPLLLYEPKANIIGAVHAGWRGTLLNITKQAIETIETLGGSASNIIAAFGPSIGMCCYTVSEERAEQFVHEFGKDLQLLTLIEGKPHLNLAYANYKQLLIAGVTREHIDYPLVCTSCLNALFYSYRKERTGLRGISYIQLTND